MRSYPRSYTRSYSERATIMVCFEIHEQPASHDAFVQLVVAIAVVGGWRLFSLLVSGRWRETGGVQCWEAGQSHPWKQCIYGHSPLGCSTPQQKYVPAHMPIGGMISYYSRQRTEQSLWWSCFFCNSVLSFSLMIWTKKLNHFLKLIKAHGLRVRHFTVSLELTWEPTAHLMVVLNKWIFLL